MAAPVQPRGSAAIGTDEWVEQLERRREQDASPLGRARRRWLAVPFELRVLACGLVAATLPLMVSSDYTLRVGVNTLLLVMLALGLNVVVGWAGLLDLGFVAFYGFGAYAYALLSSAQIDVHLPTLAAIPAVGVASALLGLLLGLPARRLMGDYLAIVTLFFGQAFLELVTNLDRVTPPGASHPLNLTGGPDGIPGVDAFKLLGHTLIKTSDYYVFLLVAVVLAMVVLHRMDVSRTGRAWRALREDPFAAEFMSVPTKRLKLLAFSVGAAVAGMTGTAFAAVQIGVYPRNFETTLLIIIYAAVILGGLGSVSGAVIGAVIVGVTLELLRTPDDATLVFFVVLGTILAVSVRPWRRLALFVGALALAGVALRALLATVLPDALADRSPSGGALGWVVDTWLTLPSGGATVGNWAFVALVVAALGITHLRGTRRLLGLAGTVYLAAIVWEKRLIEEPSITRQLLLGALLILMMSSRPQGLLGTRRVEVV
jgi:branched-chain amino acid transport system permease protein